MLDNSQGKIFLAGERGHTETEWFRSYNTFNFGDYQLDSKSSFEDLYVLNDDTIAAGRRIALTVEEDTDILLLPTVGTLSYSDSLGNETLVNAGELQLFSTPAKTTIQLTNPHENGLINYLQFWLKNPLESLSYPEIISFDIQKNKNSLIEIYSAVGRKYSIGKFGGREEITYEVSGRDKKTFVYVVEGAFEVQFRLLESRDGLGLWNLQQVEIEALSNDAIILVIEQ